MNQSEFPLKTWLANHTVRQLFKFRIFEKLLLWIYQYTRWTPILRLAPDVSMYPLETFRSCTRNGVHFAQVDIGTRNGWLLYYFQSANTAGMKYVFEGDVVFDVGGNQGETALYYAKVVGKSGIVYAFEPNPKMHAQMKVNFEANPGLNCVAVCTALGEKDGMAQMRIPDERNPGTASINSDQFSYGIILPPVKIMTLDNFVKCKNISKIDFIKMDVEGFELEVCNGAYAALTRWKPRLFMELCDIHQAKHSHTAKEVVQWLTENGYAVEHAIHGTSLSPHDDLSGCHIDIFCVPQDK